jgi:hypothetical protein
MKIINDTKIKAMTIPKLNPKRHFYLYAKGNYVRSNDLIEDLKKIAYDYCGNEVDEDGLIILVASEAYKHLNEHNFLKMLREAHPESTRSKIFDPNSSYADRILTQLLSILRRAVVQERDANEEYRVIINLGKADPEILPVISDAQRELDHGLL